MITEPEAAAIFTARHLKEEKQEEFLKASNYALIGIILGSGTVLTDSLIILRNEIALCFAMLEVEQLYVHHFDR